MSAFLEERVLSVHHWTDRLFSFTTTRDTALRFSNGHFTMIGLKGENGKPCRVILDADLLEISLVTFPANSSTSVEAREKPAEPASRRVLRMFPPA